MTLNLNWTTISVSRPALVVSEIEASIRQSHIAPLKDNKDGSGSENLRFRNQFVLGPHYVEALADWQRVDVPPSICLMAHPDLNVYQVRYAGKSLTLVGFILDPDKPQSGDAEIIEAEHGKEAIEIGRIVCSVVK